MPEDKVFVCFMPVLCHTDQVGGTPAQCGRKCLREMKDDAEAGFCWSIVVSPSAPWKMAGAVLAMFSLSVTLLCTRLLLVHFPVNLQRAGVTGGQSLSRCRSLCIAIPVVVIIHYIPVLVIEISVLFKTICI